MNLPIFVNLHKLHNMFLYSATSLYPATAFLGLFFWQSKENTASSNFSYVLLANLYNFLSTKAFFPRNFYLPQNSSVSLLRPGYAISKSSHVENQNRSRTPHNISGTKA